MCKRGTCCRQVFVCLSVCHTRVLYPYGTAKDRPIIKLLSQSGSLVATSFSFLSPSADTKVQGTFSAGALNRRGLEKFAISTDIAVYLRNGTR